MIERPAARMPEREARRNLPMPPLCDQDHVRGTPGAIVTLIEYGGYRCPHSAAVQPVVAQLLQRYPGQLRHVFRHFPMEATELVAEAAEFAASRGAFWHMHAMLFARPDQPALPLIFAVSERLGLPQNGLRDALAIGAFASRVRQDYAGGVQSGVEATPTFFIGGQRLSGASGLDALDAGVRVAIKQGGKGLPRLHLQG